MLKLTFLVCHSFRRRSMRRHRHVEKSKDISGELTGSLAAVAPQSMMGLHFSKRGLVVPGELFGMRLSPPARQKSPKTSPTRQRSTSESAKAVAH